MTQLSGKRVFVAGHRGMVGSAIVRRLESEECTILTADRLDLDLRGSEAVDAWMAACRPELIIVAAARVGGILANATYPADFLYDNLMIAANIVEAAHRYDAEKLLFLGSSCIYPRLAPQPIRENALLTGPLEPTNQWYALAKIAGIKLVEAYRQQHGRDFISAMPTNLYGEGDNYDLSDSHVLPALIHKAHLLKVGQVDRLRIWGSGKPRREFLYAEDCADACVFLLRNYSDSAHINIGAGEDIGILDLASLVCEVVGVEPRIELDASKPDGTLRKLLDVSKLTEMGWTRKITLREGIARAYADFLARRQAG